ncbi:MAG: glycosyltransferase family 39 protein [bacterium]|nr:glycosyltransferase family 39 protein [bacterium]
MKKIPASTFQEVPNSPEDRDQWLSLILWVTLFVGTLIRLYGLGAESLWLDEATSYVDAHRSIADLLLANFLPSRGEINGSFYFLFLHLVTLVASSEFALRFLSAAFGSVSIFLVYYLSTLLVRGRQGQKLGIYSAIFLALSPFHLNLCQSVRGYSLLLLLSLGAMIYQVRALILARAGDFLGFIVCSILIYNTHYLSVIFIAGQALLVSWYLVFNAEKRGRFLLSWGSCYLLIFAGIWKVFRHIQGFFSVSVSAGAPADQHFWLTKFHGAPGFNEFLGLLKVYAIGLIPESSLLNYLYFLIPVLFLAGFFSLKVKGGLFRSWEWSFGLFLFIFPVLTSFILSQSENIFLAKYLFFTLPVLYLLAARGLLNIPVRIVPEIILVLSLVAPSYAVYRIHTVPENPDWKNSVAKIISISEPGDIVAINANYTHILYNYYTREVPPNLVPVVYTMKNYSGDPQLAAAERARIGQEFDEIARSFKRMWLVSSYTNDTDPLNLVETEAVSRYQVMLWWPGPPRLYLFVLTPTEK